VVEDLKNGVYEAPDIALQVVKFFEENSRDFHNTKNFVRYHAPILLPTSSTTSLSSSPRLLRHHNSQKYTPLFRYHKPEHISSSRQVPEAPAILLLLSGTLSSRSSPSLVR